MKKKVKLSLNPDSMIGQKKGTAISQSLINSYLDISILFCSTHFFLFSSPQSHSLSPLFSITFFYLFVLSFTIFLSLFSSFFLFLTLYSSFLSFLFIYFALFLSHGSISSSRFPWFLGIISNCLGWLLTVGGRG